MSPPESNSSGTEASSHNTSESESKKHSLTNRRHVLAAVGGLGISGLAGCMGSPGGDGTGSPIRSPTQEQTKTSTATTTDSPTDSPTDTATETDTSTPQQDSVELHTAEPKANPPEPQRYDTWQKDTLVVTLEVGGVNQDFKDVIKGELQQIRQATEEAVNWWVDYIGENEDYTRRLIFEPDSDDPDIVLKAATFIEGTEYCTPEFVNPGTVNDPREIAYWTCVETLRDQPTETSVAGAFSDGLRGFGVQRHLAKHVIGRLLGYEVGAEPTEVMSRKCLYGPDFGGSAILGAATSHEHIKEHSFKHLRERIRYVITAYEASEPAGLSGVIERCAEKLKEFRKDTLYGGFYKSIKDQNQGTREVKLYLEGYEQEVVNGPVYGMIDDLVADANNLLESGQSDEELVSSDEFEDFAQKLEAFVETFETRIPEDLRVHKYWCDQIWSEFSSER